MICNFFYKEIIGIGILFFFQFYCAFSTTTVYEYTVGRGSTSLRHRAK